MTDIYASKQAFIAAMHQRIDETRDVWSNDAHRALTVLEADNNAWQPAVMRHIMQEEATREARPLGKRVMDVVMTYMNEVDQVEWRLAP